MEHITFDCNPLNFYPRNYEYIYEFNLCAKSQFSSSGILKSFFYATIFLFNVLHFMKLHNKL